MRILLIYLFLIIGTSFSYAQNQKLVVSEKKVDASIPFYEIQSMVCKQYGESRMVEKSSYGGSNYFTLNTGDKFSIEEGKISKNLQPKTDLLQYFTVQIKEEKNVQNRTTIFRIFLQEKDWEEQKKKLIEGLEKALQKEFPTYKLSVSLHTSTNREGKMTLKVYVSSSTGGDEFETTEAQKQRFKKMALDIDLTLDQLIEELYTNRIQKVRKEVVKPYQDKIKAEQNSQKLHTLNFNIEALGDYDADKNRFKNIQCENSWKLDYMNMPVDQARLFRANPKQYQIKVYVFGGNMSQPQWSPKDPSAFGFIEVVEKETQKLFIRTNGRFRDSNTQASYRFQLQFPRL